MPGDVTRPDPSPTTARPQSNDRPCPANHQRRITVAVVRHGACQTATDHGVPGVRSRFPSFVLSMRPLECHAVVYSLRKGGLADDTYGWAARSDAVSWAFGSRTC